MKIKSIRIENFRSFHDETIILDNYTCFVGPNGAGKSSILAALSIFFRDYSKPIIDEDYHLKDTSSPIIITLTFNDLNRAAKEELAHYVRSDELVVSTEISYDEGQRQGQIKQYGRRLGIRDFGFFFERHKSNAKADELNGIYERLRMQYTDLPPNPRSKDAKKEALNQYEDDHKAQCALIPSEDNFYGFEGSGKLSKHIQWVFVPAVKDASEESQESPKTAFGQLIARVVRTRVDFDDQLRIIREETMVKYQEMLQMNVTTLAELSETLKKRLEYWAHPNALVAVEWLSDPTKAVRLETPKAGVKTGENDFIGSISRMGHGLQRSYLFALLQELANSEGEDAPTLVLGCEEPELYQHPPQSRHLAEVFEQLACGNNQVLVTTHSPFFVRGRILESLRVIKKQGEPSSSKSFSLSVNELCRIIRDARGEELDRPFEGIQAKIHQALQPGVAEIFFCKIPILVEGLEDMAYIITQLHLSDQWSEFRRFGCHIVPVNGKSNIIKPLAMLKGLGIPVFVIFDSDGDKTDKPEQRERHKKDNITIMNLMEIETEPFPAEHIWGSNHVIWYEDLTKAVKNDFDPETYKKIKDEVCVSYAHEGNLNKNVLYIADYLYKAKEAGLESKILKRLCDLVIEFAREMQ